MKAIILISILLISYSRCDILGCISEGVKFSNSLFPELPKLNNQSFADILKQKNIHAGMQTFLKTCGLEGAVNITQAINLLTYYRIFDDRIIDQKSKQIEEKRQEMQRKKEEKQRVEEQIREQKQREKEQTERAQEEKDLEISGYKQQFVNCMKKLYEVGIQNFLPQLPKLKKNQTLFQIIHSQENKEIMDQLKSYCTFKNMSNVIENTTDTDQAGNLTYIQESELYGGMKSLFDFFDDDEDEDQDEYQEEEEYFRNFENMVRGRGSLEKSNQQKKQSENKNKEKSTKSKQHQMNKQKIQKEENVSKDIFQ